MSLFQTLQEDVYNWSLKNFGDQRDFYPFMGLGEEAGELADALESPIEPTDVENNFEPSEEELDAVGDMLVYLADFCARRGLDYQEAYDSYCNVSPTHDNFWREFISARGEIERSILKQEQGIDDSEKYADGNRVGLEAEQKALARLLRSINDFANKRGYTLEECIRVAWYHEVSDREWDSNFN